MIRCRFVAMCILVSVVIFSVSLSNALDWSVKKETDTPTDIVDYFLRLPQCWYDEYRDTTDIFESRKEYLVPDEMREVVVDIPNAYLQIRYLGELEERLTATYFKKADGTKIVAFSEYYMGGDCDYYSINFYEYYEDEWENITEEVLPEITFKEYWDEEAPLPEVFIPIDSNIHWHYKLPQFGTTVTVTPEPLEALICFEPDVVSGENISSSEEFEMVVDEYYTTVRGRKYSEIELKWDKQSGIFVINNKIEK